MAERGRQNDDSERLDRAFCYLTPDERQVLTCALAGNHPERLAIHRAALIRALARADNRGGELPVPRASEAPMDGATGPSVPSGGRGSVARIDPPAAGGAEHAHDTPSWGPNEA